MSRGEDIPVLHGSFKIRSPRSVWLLNPFQLPVAGVLFVVSVIFTIWPDSLDHTPVSFDSGVAHHIWHYLLMAASFILLVGMFHAGPRRLQIEVTGLILLMGVIAVNLTALVADAFTDHVPGSLSGMGTGLRLAALIGLLGRTYIVVTEPTVRLLTDEPKVEPTTDGE